MERVTLVFTVLDTYSGYGLAFLSCNNSAGPALQGFPELLFPLVGIPHTAYASKGREAARTYSQDIVLDLCMGPPPRIQTLLSSTEMKIGSLRSLPQQVS